MVVDALAEVRSAAKTIPATSPVVVKSRESRSRAVSWRRGGGRDQVEREKGERVNHLRKRRGGGTRYGVGRDT